MTETVEERLKKISNLLTDRELGRLKTAIKIVRAEKFNADIPGLSHYVVPSFSTIDNPPGWSYLVWEIRARHAHAKREIIRALLRQVFYESVAE